MNKTIRTYSDLCEERERVMNLLVVQKQRIKDDWEGVKHELNPFKKAFGVVGKMSSPNKNANPMMSKGMKVAIELFLTKFVLGKAGWVTKLAVPFVLSNYSTHVMAEKGQNFIGKMASFLKSRNKVGIKERVHSDAVSANTEPEIAPRPVVQNEPVGHTFSGDSTASTDPLRAPGM